MEPVAFRYSKIGSSLFTLLCVGMIVASSGQLIKFINAKEATNIYLIFALDAFFGLLAIYLIAKFVVPALRGQAALELTPKGIIVRAKNVLIDWNDINAIEFSRGKSFSYLIIKFKYTTDHGKNIRIPLGYVDGRDSEIRDTVVTYFDHYRS